MDAWLEILKKSYDDVRRVAIPSGATAQICGYNNRRVILAVWVSSAPTTGNLKIIPEFDIAGVGVILTQTQTIGTGGAFIVNPFYLSLMTHGPIVFKPWKGEAFNSSFQTTVLEVIAPPD